MSFIYPSFLFALSALAIPVIIHWFNLRKDKIVWFTHLKFLKEVKETSSRKRKLKHWIILACRVFFLMFLVFLFSQPYIPGIDKTGTQKETLVSIYLDNSQSMMAENEEGPLFYQAIKKAEEIISGFSPQTKFQLISHEFKAGTQTFQSSRKLNSELAEIKVTQVFRSLESVYRRQESFFAQFPDGGSKYVFWISDFQKSTAGDIKQIVADSSIVFFLLPLRSGTGQNLYVDSVYTENPFIRPHANNHLFVRIVNEGSREIKNLSIRMLLDSIRSGTSQLTIPPNGREVAEFNFTVYDVNWKKGIIEFDDNPISFDNHYFFSFKPSRKINIACIYEGENNNYMENVFSSDSVFQYRQFPERAIDYSSLGSMNLIILDRVWNPNEALLIVLLKHLENGGSLCIFPPKELPHENQNHTDLGGGIIFFSSFFDKLALNAPVWKSTVKNNENEMTYFPSAGEDENSSILLDESEEETTAYSNLAPIQTQKSDFWEGVFDIPSNGKTRSGLPDGNMDMPKAVARISWEKTKKTMSRDIIQFKNDEPYFSSFVAGKGQLFLFASEPLSDDCNLALHALFVPIVYRMAISSAKHIPMAWSLQYPSVEIPASSVTKEGIYKLTGKNREFIPLSRLSGGKLYLDIPREIATAGHYRLSGNNGITSSAAVPGYDNISKVAGAEETEMVVSLNNGKEESQLNSYTDQELKALFPKLNLVYFPEIKSGSIKNFIADYRLGKPLWEYCLFAGLFFLLGEMLMIRFWRK